MKRMHKPLIATVAAGALLVLSASLAQADSTYRIKFFACQAGLSAAKSVPANTPLFIGTGYSSGTKGLVAAAVGKTQNTFRVTYPDGHTAAIQPAYQPVQPNPDGTWTAGLRVDFAALQAGQSLTIQWTGTVSQPIEDLVPPSDDWDPAANFQPPWDGTGLKYQNHIAAGSFDNGTCTITAT